MPRKKLPDTIGMQSKLEVEIEVVTKRKKRKKRKRNLLNGCMGKRKGRKGRKGRADGEDDGKSNCKLRCIIIKRNEH